MDQRERLGPVPRGAGGLKLCRLGICSRILCPVPRGAGGLKYTCPPYVSAPYGPVPRGAGGLKFFKLVHITRLHSGPVPRGAGGLKYHDPDFSRGACVSRPARGGWIEIFPVLS